MQRRGRLTRSYDRQRPPMRAMRRRGESESAGRTQLLGAVTALLAGTMLLLHGLSVATERDNAIRTLTAVLPALSDVDQALATHSDAIQAAAAGEGALVPVPGMPVAVSVARADALAGGDQLRRATVSMLAQTVYQRGHVVFRAADAKRQSEAGWFSKQWAVERSLDVLTARQHQRISRARVAFAVATLLMVVLLLLNIDARRRLAGAGSVAAAGAAVALAGAGIGRLSVWVFASDDGVTATVIARVARDLCWSIVAVAITAGVAGLIGIVAAVVINRALPDEPSPSPVPRRSPEFVQRSWEE